MNLFQLLLGTPPFISPNPNQRAHDYHNDPPPPTTTWILSYSHSYHRSSPTPTTTTTTPTHRQFLPKQDPAHSLAYKLPKHDRPSITHYSTTREHTHLVAVRPDPYPNLAFSEGVEKRYTTTVLRDTLVVEVGKQNSSHHGHTHDPFGATASYDKYRWSVNFGSNSKYNANHSLAARYPSHPHAATVQALIEAFKTIDKIRKKYPDLRRVIVKTSSQRVVRVLELGEGVEDVLRKERDGGYFAKGIEVFYGTCEQWIRWFEGKGVEVRFWLKQ